MERNRISFTELAHLCQELNALTNRQYRPGHQLVKLFNFLSQFSRSDEFYKDEDQVLNLFATYSPNEYKPTHPCVVTNLAKFIVMPENEKKEALQNFAKQLDEHEQWEWESRRKAKNRRKATKHLGKSPSHKATKFSESPQFFPVAGMNSLSRPTSIATISSMSSMNTSLSSMSSEEPEESNFRYVHLDPWEKMSLLGLGGEKVAEHESYHSEMRESYRRHQHEPQCQNTESGTAHTGKSFHITNRHISAQLYQSPDHEYETVLALERWEWNDKHYSDLVNRLDDDEDRHMSPSYVDNFY